MELITRLEINIIHVELVDIDVDAWLALISLRLGSLTKLRLAVRYELR